MNNKKNVLLEIKNLSVSYGDINMISGVNMEITPGDIVCLAGESGCGKSTLLKSIMNLPALETEITDGEIIFDGVNVEEITLKERIRMAGPVIGMVQQYLNGAFNPLRTYRSQFYETLASHDIAFEEKQALDIFDKLSLPDGERILKSRPFEMSGGMNQRIVIALAMLLSPKLLLCDEPTSALDVSTQKHVIEEIVAMRDAQNTAVLLVTHNLGVAAAMADYVGIMYAGHLVEYGKTKKVLKNPTHPYTRALLAAIPDFSFRIPRGLDGQPPVDGATMETCAFSPRCPYKDKVKNDKPYEFRTVEDDHFSTCCPRI